MECTEGKELCVRKLLVTSKIHPLCQLLSGCEDKLRVSSLPAGSVSNKTLPLAPLQGLVCQCVCVGRIQAPSVKFEALPALADCEQL